MRPTCADGAGTIESLLLTGGHTSQRSSADLRTFRSDARLRTTLAQSMRSVVTSTARVRFTYVNGITPGESDAP